MQARFKVHGICISHLDGRQYDVGRPAVAVAFRNVHTKSESPGRVGRPIDRALSVLGHANSLDAVSWEQ